MEQRPSFFKRASDGETRKERDEFRELNTDRPEKFEREERRERPERRERSDRFERRDRSERFDRSERPERRSERGERGGYVTRAPRREDRPEREDRRDERPRRDDRRGGEGRQNFGKPEDRKPLAIPDNLIFGVHPVREALEAGRGIDKIYTVKNGNETITSIVELAEENGVAIQYVPTPKLDYLSKQNNHQGIVAILSAIEYADLAEVLEKEPKLILVLDGVTDVRNFGAIARSAECSGVDAIIVSAKNSAAINGEAMKSSAGALSRIPVCKVGSLRNTLKTIQMSGIELVAATEKTESCIYDLDLTKPMALIMGSEERGISTDTLKLCDQKGSIPLLGTIESLNVSAAAAVILYEVVRQRR